MESRLGGILSLLSSAFIHLWTDKKVVFVQDFFKNSSVVDLQYRVSFRSTAQLFRYIYIYVYICILYILQILFPYRLLQNIKYSSLCYTVGLCAVRVFEWGS